MRPFVEQAAIGRALSSSFRSFVVLAYAITWLLLAPWFYLFTVVYHQKPPGWVWLLAPLAFIGGWGPSVAAIVLTLREEPNRAGMRRLLAGLLAWRVPPYWYVTLVVLPPLLTALALVIVEGGVGSLAELDAGRVLAHLPLAYAIALPFGPLGEELGWRGYALPRLLRTGGPWRATIVLGVVWTFWHIPMMLWMPGASMPAFMPMSAASVLIYLAKLTGISGVMTLVFIHSRGSVLLAVLAHLTFNTAEDLLFAGLPALPRDVVESVYLLNVALIAAVGLLSLALATRDDLMKQSRAAVRSPY